MPEIDIPAEARAIANWTDLTHTSGLANDIESLCLRVRAERENARCYECDGPLNGPYCPKCAEREWRPISEAPRDGTRILVLIRNREDKLVPVVARWLTDIIAGSEWSTGIPDSRHEGWMPLPLPPKETTPRHDLAAQLRAIGADSLLPPPKETT